MTLPQCLGCPMSSCRACSPMESLRICQQQHSLGQFSAGHHLPSFGSGSFTLNIKRYDSPFIGHAAATKGKQQACVALVFVVETSCSCAMSNFPAMDCSTQGPDSGPAEEHRVPGSHLHPSMLLNCHHSRGGLLHSPTMPA